MNKSLKCHYCKNSILITDKMGFDDACPYCGSDLHACLNCEHYDEKAHQQCNEPNADFVSQKEKSNVCPFFTICANHTKKENEDTPTKSFLEKAEALFKKTG